MSPQVRPEACGLDFEDNESKSYVEMWMETHPKGPSTLYDHPNTSPASFLVIDTEYFLGPRTISKFPLTSDKESNKRSPEIPYLFKVLSIAKALPLQALPNKKLAEKLKITNQKGFVDANHKPEMALALGDFRGFVGFKPIKDILQVSEATPELRQGCGIEITARDAVPIKSIVSSLLLRAQSEIEPFVRAVVDRLQAQNDAFSNLVLEVNSQYPGDVAVLVAPFLMNLVTLSKGEAVYIGADDAHAYISGDIIECMAASDNVVNAAFVPPEDRDPRTLGLRSTPYKGSTRGRTTAYDPPLAKFTVLHSSLDPHYNEEQLQPAPGPTTGIVLEGEVHITTAADKEDIFKGRRQGQRRYSLTSLRGYAYDVGARLDEAEEWRVEDFEKGLVMWLVLGVVVVRREAARVLDDGTGPTPNGNSGVVVQSHGEYAALPILTLVSSAGLLNDIQSHSPPLHALHPSPGRFTDARGSSWSLNKTQLA
ncbi:RmlC-like cupin domain-containing protein [Hysterangium stoloniferum]|nr:RmlC-like cupin domain-containing protein [Hysterangium stoloniferum]